MRYRLSMPDPDSHLFHVEARLARPGTAELCFPVWTPGSYLVREFARHVEGFQAEDGAGRPLPVTRLDKHRFSVAAGEEEELVVRYRVYANELSVRTSHLDGSHGYLNGAGVFPYAAGRLGEACQLEVVAPPGWHVSTALEGGPSRFTARDYDELADSPLEIGTHRVLRVEAAGKPHELAIWGRAHLDEAALAEDVRRIVEVFARLLGPVRAEPVEGRTDDRVGSHSGRTPDPVRPEPVEGREAEGSCFDKLSTNGRGKLELNERNPSVRPEPVEGRTDQAHRDLPYDRYLFIVHLADKRRGGLEHAASTTLNVGRTGFFPRETYEETLGLVAHEYFHLWNVKRLRPAAFNPYDYTREQYTRLLWWFEGVTSYYDGLALVRAGITEPRRYLRTLGQAFTTLSRSPGAGKMSVEEASFLAWVKLYRPDENTANSTISYYLKGELVALALDLALRSAGSSLDALLRALLARHAERGLPEDGVEAAAAELMGAEAARSFFDRFVRGVEPLEPGLEQVGLRLRRRAAAGFDDKGGTPPPENGPREPGWLGADLAAGPKLTVQSVREGSPAARAGLYAEDEIVAEDGFRVDRAALWDRLCQEGPGERLRLTVFRRDELHEVEVTLAPPPADTVWIEPDDQAPDGARAAFEAWSGARWPGGAA